MSRHNVQASKRRVAHSLSRAEQVMCTQSCPFSGCSFWAREKRMTEHITASHPHPTEKVKRDWMPPWGKK